MSEKIAMSEKTAVNDASENSPGDDLLTKNWQRLLAALKQCGDIVDMQLKDSSIEVRADAYRALLRAFSAQLGKQEADGRFPLLLHVNPPHQKWFLDNPDGRTLHCTLDPSQRYRLWGNPGAAVYTSFTCYEGKGDSLATRVTARLDDRQLTRDAEGCFELTLSAEAGAGPNHIQLDAATGQLWIRQLFNDSEHDAPGWFLLENLSPDSAPPSVDPEGVAGGMKRLSRAMPMLTQMMFAGWKMQTANHPVNQIRVWTEMQNGALFTSDDIHYFIGSWKLAANEALHIEVTLPVCRHWNIVLYSPMLNSLEHHYRCTSLTNARLQDVQNSIAQIVIAHQPGQYPNWLDSEGRPEGLLVIRATGVEGEAPLPVTRVFTTGLETSHD